MFPRNNHARQRGDTIVEVLIAIAIVSFVLTAAYALTNRNTVAFQSTQERSTAQKLVANQVEHLRSSADPTQAIGKCYFIAGGLTTNCQVNEKGLAVSPTYQGPLFTKKITKNSAGVYLVSVEWSTIEGSKGDVTVEYYYK